MFEGISSNPATPHARAARAQVSPVHAHAPSISAADDVVTPQSAATRCRLCGAAENLTIALSSETTNLLKCASCGVAFIDPLPPPESLTEHFRNDYITDESYLENVYGELRKGALGRIAREVQKHKTSGKILDVGCAGGYFLDRYFPATRWEKFGIEPSRYALRRAIARQIHTFEGEVRSVRSARRSL